MLTINYAYSSAHMTEAERRCFERMLTEDFRAVLLARKVNIDSNATEESLLVRTFERKPQLEAIAKALVVSIQRSLHFKRLSAAARL